MPRVRLVPVLGFAVAVLALSAARGQEARAPVPDVVVRVNEVTGRFVPERFNNLATDGLYGVLNSPLADAALEWARATRGLSYVRCWNWLGDGYSRSQPRWQSGCGVVPAAGAPARFEALEQTIDALLTAGVKPWIVCGAMPDALAEGPVRRNDGGGGINAPRDYEQYRDLLTQMFKRLLKTYGAREVRTWYFEAWAQPDHEGSWAHGRAAPFATPVEAPQCAPFLRLYDAFTAAAVAADRNLAVGGPGIAGDESFLRRFLTHCTTGKNAFTGQPVVRPRFVSWCAYGSPEAIVARNATLRRLVAKEFPELTGLEFAAVESTGGPGSETEADRVGEAARLAAVVIRTAASDQPVDWYFRSGCLIDEQFDGDRPLITRLGRFTVPTPAFRLAGLLEKLSSERVATSVPSGVLALATVPAGKALKSNAQLLLCRDPGTAPAGGKLKVRFTGLPASLLKLPVRVYLPELHGVHEQWTAAGMPTIRAEDSPERQRQSQNALETIAQAMLGERPLDADRMQNDLAVRGGEASLEIELGPGGTALVTLGTEPSFDIAVGQRAERLRKAQDEFAAAAELQVRGSQTAGTATRTDLFERAVAALRQIQNRYADTAWRKAALGALEGIYELDLKSPEQAEAVRGEILALTLTADERLALLRGRRVAAARSADQEAVRKLTAEMAGLEKAVAASKVWAVRRYEGP